MDFFFENGGVGEGEGPAVIMYNAHTLKRHF